MCEIEGEYSSKFSKLIFWPKESKRATLRNNNKWRQTATALQLEKNQGTKPQDATINGIKGICELMKLQYIDLSTVCPPEPMHSQYLGI